MLDELRHFPTPRARAHALWRAAREQFRVRRLYLSPIWIAAFLSAFVLLQVIALLAASYSASAPVGLGLAAAHWLLIGAVLTLHMLKGMRRSLRRQLFEIGIAVCWNCGYDLQGGMVEGRLCPECGSDCTDPAFQLQRLLPESETYPELRRFPNEHAARSAFAEVRQELGVAYSRRVVIAGMIGLGVVVVESVLFQLLDSVFYLSESGNLVRVPLLIISVCMFVAAMLLWFVYVRNRVRAGLRRRLP